ncbi:hypothetical protein A0J48_022575 [Sphaerospermopsis aphanizomenoides BCCUSP55]|uniref:hypothetical protein n=1 Tax=Sphaerospermopsis aphanizomenoides TaxID=459663 RepID=UPI0019060B5F|nr:hypothetical protein [Sphaerospermopsis aphanizomenoides]MBK1990276.1 hypothetical protein [Sphaerospermopsis aphanizomenoides BCCUSP55]
MTSAEKITPALKWWFYRQSIKLFLEAEKIRDSLLQESFTIRRSLEVLKIDHLNLSTHQISEHIKKIENFHHSLVQLSDRLCPVYIQDSLPLSIQSLLDPWLTSNPHVYFHIDMPISWRNEPVECSFLILRALEELLTITLPQFSTAISIHISLKEKENARELTVHITYPDISSMIFYSNLPELKYLSDSVQFLIPGKCFYKSRNMRIAWYFCW